MATSNRLQDNLRTTMKAYSHDKERLVHQLSGLNSTDRCSSTLSTESSGDLSPAMKRKQFFRAPNLAASGAGVGVFSAASSEGSHISAEKRWRDRKEAEKIKKEKDLLKLPVIHSARSKRSEWESGKLWQSELPRTLPGIEPLPGITAAKAFLAESMKIPSIYDPQRSDTAFDKNKSKSPRKKVTFADETHGFIHESNKDGDKTKNNRDSKNFQKNGTLPELQLTQNQFVHTSRQVRPRKTSLLPPLNITMENLRKNPQKVTQGLNEWKSVYSTIINQEQRNRALADILQAVKLKKIENEQAIKYGDSPRSSDKDIMVQTLLTMNATDKIQYRNEFGQASIHIFEIV